MTNKQVANNLDAIRDSGYNNLTDEQIEALILATNAIRELEEKN